MSDCLLIRLTRLALLSAAILAGYVLLVASPVEARVCTASLGGQCSYADFVNLLGQSESSGNYGACNSYGYCGKYQMGHDYLIDAGYVVNDGKSGNNYGSYQWTAKAQQMGVTSMTDFLSSPSAQDQALRDGQARTLQQISSMGLDRYIGTTTPDGVLVTQSGLLAAAHLGGLGGVRRYLDGTGNAKDAYGTSVADYMSCFGGCDLSGNGEQHAAIPPYDPCPPGCDPAICAALQQASISGASNEIGSLNPPAFWAPPPIRELSCLDELFGLGLNILSGPFDLNILSLIKRLVCGAVQSKLYQATSYVNGQLATAGGYVSPTLLGQSILPAPQVYLGTGNSSLGQVNMTGSILSTPTQQNILDRYCDPGMGGCPAKTTTLDNLFK